MTVPRGRATATNVPATRRDSPEPFDCMRPAIWTVMGLAEASAPRKMSGTNRLFHDQANCNRARAARTGPPDEDRRTRTAGRGPPDEDRS
jgi:hypothetical protein